MTVTLPYDPEWQALHWAKQNCPSYITNTAVLFSNSENAGTPLKIYSIHYYFGDERDAVAFALKWT